VPVPQDLLSSPGFLLAMVGAESRKRWVEGLAQWETRPSQFAALMVLGERGPISQRDLAGLIGVDPRNLVTLVDSLEDRGLVARGPHPKDRRRHAVELTAAGRRFLRQLQRSGAAVERDMLAGLDDSERAALGRLLLKLLPTVTTKGE
jgi:DNA-binding MarR family transcriptional regulator